MKKGLIVFFIIIVLCGNIGFVFADEIDDISTALTNLKRDLEASINATSPLEKNITQLNNQLTAIHTSITNTERSIGEKERSIRQSEKELLLQKGVLDKRIFQFYKNINKSRISLIQIFTADNFSSSFRQFMYQKKAADNDKQIIVKAAYRIQQVEEQKTILQNEKSRLSSIKKQVDTQSAFLQKEVDKAKTYQKELSSKIAQLSARQKQLIAQKLAALNIPRSAGTSTKGCVDDRGVDPGFGPRIAFFTFGVPNRTGLNQYGAKGRAESGQNVEDILRAYYDSYELKKDYNTSITITVDGMGSFSIEDYVKRVFEVPIDWPMEALKAQAIAARSYALAYTNNGSGSICATQQCQVAHAEEKGGRWNEAVEATRGWVMVQGGNPIKAWYSSTHGGYTLNSAEIGWSATSWTKHASDTSQQVASFEDLFSYAYDKSSPWFYCDWGARSEYKNTAWMKTAEVADIVNSIQLSKLDASAGEHLYQPDKPNPAGVDTWDSEKVKSELRARGGNPFETITDISISADFNAGKTTSITLSGNAGSVTLEGREFKDWFNLRAPSNIQIVGPLFKAERQ